MKMLTDLPPRCRWWQFDAPDLLAEALAISVAQSLTATLQHSARASLALSGGNTPKKFIQALCKQDIDWPSVDVCLVDERWVPLEHEQSNEGHLRALVTGSPMSAAHFVSLLTPDEAPQDAIAALEARFAEFCLPFDVCVLGMGEDGHTASLFPGMPRLDEALAENSPQFLAVPEGFKGPPRISFGAKELLAARRRVLHLEGSGKWQALQQICKQSNASEHPVWRFLSHGACELVWAPQCDSSS